MILFRTLLVAVLVLSGVAFAKSPMDNDEQAASVRRLVDFMKVPDVVHLSSIGDDGWPHIRVMLNFRNKIFAKSSVFAKDDFGTVFATGRDTEKVRHFRKNNKAGVYYYTTNINTRSLFVMGHIEFVDDLKEREKYFDTEWLKHYPKGAKDENLVILKFVPAKVKSYYRGELDTFNIQ